MWYSSIFILLAVYQCEACLDLLVRSFNELFSPVIESDESRRLHWHDVDELTRYYKRDDDGSIVLDDEAWQPPKAARRNSPAGRHMVGSLFQQLSRRDSGSRWEAGLQDRTVDTTDDDDDGAADEVEALDYSLERGSAEDPEYVNEGDEAVDGPDGDKWPPYRPRRPYVPGDRPLVDFIVKVLELFQPIVESQFVVGPQLVYTSHTFEQPDAEDDYA